MPLLVVTLDHPAPQSAVDQVLEGDLLWQRGEPVVRGLGLTRWPFNQEPLPLARQIVTGHTDAYAGKARRPWLTTS